MQKETIDRTVEFLYQRALNVSSRIKSFAKDDSAIEKPLVVDTINIGVEHLQNRLFIRLSFVGSGKYYSLGIEKDKLPYWMDFVMSFYNSNRNFDLDFLEGKLYEIESSEPKTISNVVEEDEEFNEDNGDGNWYDD